MANLGFLDTEGNIFHLDDVVTPTKKKKKDEDVYAMANMPLSVQPTVTVTPESNLKNAEKELKEASDIFQNRLAQEIKKTGKDYKTTFDNRANQKITYQTKKEDIKPQPDIIPIVEAKQNLQQELENKQKAYDQWKIANYENNLNRVQNEESTLFDKTLGVPIRATKDLLSPLTIGEDITLKDEKGNKTFLPSYNELKQQQVRQDTSGIGGFAQDIAYNATKVLEAGALDAVTGGIGGKALYWTDMSADNYINAKNQGATNKQAIANTIVLTGSEFLTEKLLGGLSKQLTGGKASEIQNIVSNAVNKLVKNPKVSNIIGSMGSEALEEWVQEWVGALNNKITLGEELDVEKTLKDSLYSAAVGAGSGGVITGTNNVEGRIAANNSNILNERINTLKDMQNMTTNENTKAKIDESINKANEYISKPFGKDAESVMNESNNDMQEIAKLLRLEEKETQQETLQTAPTEQNDVIVQKEIKTEPTTQEAAQKEQVEEKPSRRIGNRDYSSSKFDNLSDEDIKELDRIYEGYKQTGKISEEDNAKLDILSKKANYIKNPEINTNINEFKDVSKDYTKYGKKADLENFDTTMTQKAKETIEGNKQGRRTKEQWLDVAKNIGMQAENLNSEELKKYAFASFMYEKPNQKQNLNRQGQKYVSFGVQDWVKAVYEGAGVGKKLQQPEQTAKNLQNISNTTKENIPEEKAKEPVLKVETPKQQQEHLQNEGVSEEMAKVLTEIPKPEKKSISEKIKDGKSSLAEEWSYFKRNIVDKGETIYKIAKKTKNNLLYAKYDKRGTTTAEANYDIGKAQTNLQGKNYSNFTNKNGEKVSMSLNNIWDEVQDIDPKIVNEYLAHQLNVDRYNQYNEDGTRKYVFSPEFTDADSKKVIEKFEKEYPELKRFGENVWQYGKNQLQNMVDAGMISEKQAQQFMKETPHYVRLQRDIPSNATTIIEFDKNGNAKVNKQVKEFKGSTLNILPFKETMAQYTLDVRNSIRNNIFADELARTIGTDGNNQQANSVDDIMGINPELIKDNGDGTYSLTFFNKGTATTIPITEGIYESLQPNKHYKFEDKLLFKGIRKFENVRKALLTDKNPMFLATNMMKDAFDAPLNSKHPARFIKNYPKAINQIIKNGNYYQQYQALGGLQNSYFEKGEGFTKQRGKYNPLGWIEKANNAVEQFPRLAEFISTMEATGNIDEAMYNAAEITTNFKRGGDVAKVANRNGATFLNASIQGFDKQFRNFSEIQNPKQAVQLLGKIVVLGIAPALINDAMWDDDDEYQEMQDYQKDRYYLFKGKDGTWIRIPKGRAISIFQSAARRTKYALKGEENTFEGFGKFASDQVAPNNPFENNVISPFVDVSRNESWSGNKIIPSSFEGKKAEEQYNEKTDKVSKAISKAINKSETAKKVIPKNFRSAMGINYLLDQYSGAIGDLTLPYITPKASSKSTNPVTKPITDKFTTDAVYSNKSVNSFYDTKTMITEEGKSDNATPLDKAKMSYMDSKSYELSELYKKQREIQNNENLSKSKKYDQAREVQKEINEFTKQVVKDVNNIDKEEYYLKIGNSYYKKVVKDGVEKYQKDTSKKIPTEKYALYDYFKEKYEKSKEAK